MNRMSPTNVRKKVRDHLLPKNLKGHRPDPLWLPIIFLFLLADRFAENFACGKTRCVASNKHRRNFYEHITSQTAEYSVSWTCHVMEASSVTGQHAWSTHESTSQFADDRPKGNELKPDAIFDSDGSATAFSPAALALSIQIPHQEGKSKNGAYQDRNSHKQDVHAAY